MKKIAFLFTLTLAFCMGTAKAQNPSFVPASFTANDAFTLTVDVSGTPMAGETEAYIWIFSNTSPTSDADKAAYPAKDGYTNTAWGNSPVTAKMTAAGTNKWSFKVTSGVALFSQSPGQLKDFGFLVKSQTGSKQTPDFKPYFFDLLVFKPTTLRIFPAKVDKDDIVTLNFERTLSTIVQEQRMTATGVTVTAFDEAGTQVGNPLTFPVKKVTSNIWNASLVISDNFTPTTGHSLYKFRYKFIGTALDVTGAAASVTSSESEIIFTALK
ncbi:hypothetical protein [Parasediminibacterium sp. JCM 36343]|uniref:hypothetical protein n=1 Tax=Parasediminibacterium sp. JCM 36343 TaxID=3374279 RepID=UPI00397B2857